MFYLSQSELILHLLLTSSLFGLIWIVQLVHYPAFNYISEDRWSDFHRMHTRNITWIVMPLMICELAIAAWLAGKNGFRMDYAVPLCLVLGIWASTFLFQIPIHTELSRGKDATLIKKLIRSNWIRTLLWTVKMVWVSWLAYINWG